MLDSLNCNHNLCLVDWLTFSCRGLSPSELISRLRLTDCSFEHLRGRYGYSQRMHFDGISILFDGSDDMGICLDMSGSGCRCFETHSSLTWQEVFSFIVDPSYSCNITRLDLAFDDHTGILDIQQLLDDTDEHNYTSNTRWWLVEYGSTGTCIYHGSPRSAIRVRIYDKAAERGILDGKHWIRVELVLRDENARGAIERLINTDIGIVFRGILANTLCYRVPNDFDSNKSRWEVCPYWSELLDGVSAIHVFSYPKREYNIFRLERLIRDTYGSAIQAWIDIFDLDSLECLIKKRRSPMNPNHRKLVDQYIGGKYDT